VDLRAPRAIARERDLSLGRRPGRRPVRGVAAGELMLRRGREVGRVEVVVVVRDGDLVTVGRPRWIIRVRRGDVLVPTVYRGDPDLELRIARACERNSTRTIPVRVENVTVTSRELPMSAAAEIGHPEVVVAAPDRQ